MTLRLALHCACGCEFTVPAGVPVGSLVPCPRCSQTLRISHVPVEHARPVSRADHRPPSYAGPRKRLGVPSAPGHVSLRRSDSDVLVNFGLWTLLAGVLSTLLPILPIQSATWDLFIAYQPWAGLIIAASGVLMMIVYQSGPDFARGPGAPLLVVAFWAVGITLGVFAGWTAERVRQRQVAEEMAAATAPPVQQQSPPLARFDAKGTPPAAAPITSPPQAQPQPPVQTAAAPASTPPASSTPGTQEPPTKGFDPFGISGDKPVEQADAGRKASDASRNFGTVKGELKSDDKKVLLRALEEVQWYFRRDEQDAVVELLAPLLTHPDEEVLLATVKALKIWGNDSAAAALVPLAAHDSTEIRVAAIQLLGRFPSPAGLTVLVERLADDTAEAKAALLKAGKGAEGAVRKGLKSKSAAVRLECVKLVGQLGAKQALRDLRSLAEFDKDGQVKGEARRVADELAAKK